MKKIELIETFITGENLPPTKERYIRELDKMLQSILETGTEYRISVVIESTS